MNKYVKITFIGIYIFFIKFEISLTVYEIFTKIVKFSNLSRCEGFDL